MIRRRHVFHIAGYDPVQPSDQYRRFARQLDIFKDTWNVRSTLSASSQPHGYPRWTIWTSGPDWTVESTYELLPWDDLVRKDAQGSEPLRLLRSAQVYLNLFVTGTLFRYTKANTRYFVFTLFPWLQIALLAVVAWYPASILFSLWNPIGAPNAAMVAPIGLAIFILLLRWPGRRWRLQQALDDWIFSFDFIHGRRADIEARLNAFAERLVACIREGGVDEVVIVGHSLGATFAVDIAARALEMDQDLGRRGIKVSVVTVGATIPKCALHPDAQRIRDQIARLATEPSLFWAEYQSRSDPISFYRFNPATLSRITSEEATINSKPTIRRTQIHDMLKPETFAKYKFRVLRLHYQSVMANDRRSAYDYFMLICGPVALEQWSLSKLGLLDFFHHAEDARITSHDGSKAAP